MPAMAGVFKISGSTGRPPAGQVSEHQMAYEGVDQEILQDFIVEAGEYIENLSEQLVDLEKTPEDSELLNSIFRAYHTIKGGAGFGTGEGFWAGAAAGAPPTWASARRRSMISLGAGSTGYRI